MTTIDPSRIERVFEIKDLIAINNVAELELATRALQAEAHLLEARLTHTRELQKVAAHKAKLLSGG